MKWKQENKWQEQQIQKNIILLLLQHMKKEVPKNTSEQENDLFKLKRCLLKDISEGICLIELREDCDELEKK